MERALILQGLLCIVLALGLAIGQWLWPADSLEFAAQTADRSEPWSETAGEVEGETAPAVARRVTGDADGCPG